MARGVIFYKTQSTEPIVSHLADLINAKLATGHKLLWLVPGGSGIATAAKVSRLIHSTPANLTIGLTDERFGPVGHSDSNWRQLLDRGFDFSKATQLPVLNGKDLDTTTKRFGRNLKTALAEADFSIGLFGMGSDGHTAGIKPGSPAVNSKELTAGFEWKDYERITLTPKAIANLDEVVLAAFGDNKRAQLELLQADASPDEQPAQVLKQAGTLTVYNNQIGGEV